MAHVVWKERAWGNLPREGVKWTFIVSFPEDLLVFQHFLLKAVSQLIITPETNHTAPRRLLQWAAYSLLPLCWEQTRSQALVPEG